MKEDMVAGGLPVPRKDHLERVADFALELIQAVQDFNEAENTQIQVRIGMHCGPVVAGVIGMKRKENERNEKTMPWKRREKERREERNEKERKRGREEERGRKREKERGRKRERNKK